jgi:hypothetical protein
LGSFPLTPLLYPDTIGKIVFFLRACALFIPALASGAANTLALFVKARAKSFLFRHYRGRLTRTYAIVKRSFIPALLCGANLRVWISQGANKKDYSGIILHG